MTGAAPSVDGGILAGVPLGTWRIDPAHSSVGFAVRHLMSRVRGRFAYVDGRVRVGPRPADCAVSVSIGMSSVDTGTAARDDDLRSESFFDVDAHPVTTFASTAVEIGSGDAFAVLGDLTVRGVTRAVRLDAEFLGFDPAGLQGEPRIGFSARTTVRRSDFGVGARSVEGSRIVVGDDVTVELDVEAYREEERS